MLELIIACLSTIGNVSLGAVVLAKNPNKQVNRYFAYFAGSLALWAMANFISVNPVVFDQLFWIRLVMAVVVMMSLFILLLANSFPDGVPEYKRLPKFAIPASFVMIILALSPWLFIKVNYDTLNHPEPLPGPAMLLFVPYAAVTLSLSVAILFRKFRRLHGDMREYTRYALIGIVLTFSLLLATNFFAVLVLRDPSFVAFSPVFGLIFTTSFAYGMIRYRLFDIRAILARFIAYLLLLVLAGGFYGLTIVSTSFFISGIRPNIPQVILSTVTVGFLILLVQPLRHSLNRITRKIFYQDDYNTKEVLDKLASVLVHSTVTKTLILKSLHLLSSALRPQYIYVVLFEGAEENSRAIGIGKRLTHQLSAASVRYIREMPEILTIDSLPEGSGKIMEEMNGIDATAIARLKTQSGVIGYCLFGPKISGSGYSQRDIDLIRIVSGELAVAIQNTLRFEQIQEFNNTLKQRINDATEELRASNLQLQRLDEAKDEFVSMASHQLRTPLTSVKGYISMVLEGDAGRVTIMQQQLLGEAFTSSERMVHLINDFLNVSRLQTGKFMLDRSPIDLSKVISQEVESLQTTARAHLLKLHYRAPSRFPILYIDEGKIRQVAMNFIDNAIFYSHEHTSISIKLYVDHNDVVLEVHDTGIGVPEAERAKLFTKFFRATNARRQRPDGTGVGLFLAKKVIVGHGGSMVFDSVEGRGSTFGFRLPIAALKDAPSEDETK